MRPQFFVWVLGSNNYEVAIMFQAGQRQPGGMDDKGIPRLQWHITHTFTLAEGFTDAVQGQQALGLPQLEQMLQGE